jgi:hypothetical protein
LFEDCHAATCISAARTYGDLTKSIGPIASRFAEALIAGKSAQMMPDELLTQTDDLTQSRKAANEKATQTENNIGSEYSKYINYSDLFFLLFAAWRLCVTSGLGFSVRASRDLGWTSRHFGACPIPLSGPAGPDKEDPRGPV